VDVTPSHLLGGVGLILQTGAFGFFVGKLWSGVKKNERDILGSNKRLDKRMSEIESTGKEVHSSINSTLSELKDLFVAKTMCEANQDKWKGFASSLSDRREYTEEANTKEHKGIVDFLKELKQDIKEDRAEDRAELRTELDSIHDCLKNIQKKLVC